MNQRPLLTALNEYLAANGIEPLTEKQASFFNCLIAAAIKNLPVIIADVMACMAGVPPPAGGYDPGDRKRCA